MANVSDINYQTTHLPPVLGAREPDLAPEAQDASLLQAMLTRAEFNERATDATCRQIPELSEGLVECDEVGTTVSLNLYFPHLLGGDLTHRLAAVLTELASRARTA